MDATTRSEIDRIIHGEARRFLRRGFQVEEADLCQEGWRIALEAAASHASATGERRVGWRDKGGAPLGAYVRRAVVLGLGLYVAQRLAVVHVAWHRARNGEAKAYQASDPLHLFRDGGGQPGAVLGKHLPRQLRNEGTPEREVLKAEHTSALALWRVRVRTELEVILDQMPAAQRRMAQALADDDFDTRDLAALLGERPRALAATRSRLRARVASSPRLAALWLERPEEGAR